MCDPLTIAGIAMSVGSSVVNAVASNKVQAARNDAMAAERIRQNTFDKEAAAVNTTSQDRYQNFDAKVAEGSQQLGDYISNQTAPEAQASEALPSAGASNITVQEEAKQKAKAKASTNASGKALGELRAFGDVLGDTSRLQARDAGQVAQIGGFKTGSSNVLPYELEAANNKGAGLKLFGDLLGGVGSVATSAGMMGGKLPFGLGASAGVPVTKAVKASVASPVRLGHLYGGGK